MDSIWIMACSGGGCKVTMSVSAYDANEITLDVLYDVGSARVDKTLTGWQCHIDWGDDEGSFTSGGKGVTKSVTHEYADEGEYTITVNAWNAKKLESGGSSSSPTTAVGYSKNQDGIPTAANHALCLAKEWEVTTTGTENTAGFTGTRRVRYTAWFDSPDFGWEMHKITMAIDLSGEKTGKMIGILQYNTDTASNVFGVPDVLHRPAIYKNGELLMNVPNNGRLTRGDITEYLLLSSLSELTEIEFKDLGDYAFPAAHNPAGEVEDYFIKLSSGTFTCTFHPYDCKAKKTLTVTVPEPEE
jgi:hypothetical protein